MRWQTPSYQRLRPASKRASRAARGASKKKDTRCEVKLRRALWRAGCRYRTHFPGLPGRPDLVFTRARVVVFCDGDFWHGKDWQARRAKLEKGTNPRYWVAKIESNIARDRRHATQLEAAGWTVLRVWESDVHQDLERAVDRILDVLDQRGHRRP